MHDIHDQVDVWFTFHPPQSDTRRQAHVTVRDGCRDLAHQLADTVPPSNELDGAIWHLRQVAMWANAGLALAPDPEARPGGCPSSGADAAPRGDLLGVAAAPGGEVTVYEQSSRLMADRSGATPRQNLLADQGCPGSCAGAPPQ